MARLCAAREAEVIKVRDSRGDTGRRFATDVRDQAGVRRSPDAVSPPAIYGNVHGWGHFRWAGQRAVRVW